MTTPRRYTLNSRLATVFETDSEARIRGIDIILSDGGLASHERLTVVQSEVSPYPHFHLAFWRDRVLEGFLMLD